eukprot:CAMPEP_0114231776 /NCGR_PEP_ID=MMETSP0058-20121206/4239_1 /TAXON_ID=36894 /ORGANISM="Pyramimonas parkeae, CCMP726" /LENGTH=429 /DNA_ID=CAMNT_0001343177 /DNA_START=217 /DNA_END=1503 /DNA_ORIENTATION=-
MPGQVPHPRVAAALAVTIGLGVLTLIARSANKTRRESQGRALPWERWIQKVLRLRRPLSDWSWEQCFDEEGKLVLAVLRAHVLAHGIEPHLRAQVWPALLGVEEHTLDVQGREAHRRARRARFYQMQHCRIECLQSTPTTSSWAPAWLRLMALPATPGAEEAERAPSRSIGEARRSQESPSPTRDSAATARGAPGSPDTAGAQKTAPPPTRGFEEAAQRIALDTPRTPSPSEEVRVGRSASGGGRGAARLAARAERLRFEARVEELLELWALHDAEVGYCQGMNDLASPFVHYFQDDSECFWAFEAMMRRLGRRNFLLDGSGVAAQFEKLEALIQRADPHLHAHLQSIGASQCFFLYRTLLVMLRRDFPFEQVMTMWDVLFAHQDADYIVYLLYAIVNVHRSALLRCTHLDEAVQHMLVFKRRVYADVW